MPNDEKPEEFDQMNSQNILCFFFRCSLLNPKYFLARKTSYQFHVQRSKTRKRAQLMIEFEIHYYAKKLFFNSF